MNRQLFLTIFVLFFLFLGSAKPANAQEWREDPEETPTGTPTSTPTPLPTYTPTPTPLPATTPTPAPTQAPSQPPPQPTPTPVFLSLNSVEPTTLLREEGGVITVLGEGFEESMAVRLVGFGLLDTTYANRSMARAVVPAGVTPGVYALQVVRTGGETAALEAALTVIAAAVTPEPAPSPSPTPDMRLPALLVCEASPSSNQIRPGDEFSLTVVLCNAGGLGVSDGMILFDSQGLVPAGEKGRRFGEVPPGGSVSISQKLRVPTSAAAGITMVEVTIQANDVKGVLHTFQGSTPVEIAPKPVSSGGGGAAQSPRLVILSAETNPSEVIPGSQYEISFRILNMGGKASQVLFTAVPDAVAAPVKGIESMLVETIPAGGEVVVALPLSVRANVQAGYYEMILNADFTGSQPGSVELKYGIEIATGISNHPRLIVLEYRAAPDFISQGDRLELTIIIANQGRTPARQAAVNLGGTPENLRPFSPLGSGNVRYLPGLEPGESAEVSFNLIVDGKAEARAYNLGVDLIYLGEKENEFKESQVISLLVQNRPFFQVGFYREVSFATVGQQIRLPIEVANLSAARFNVLSIVLSSQQIEFSAGEVFVGKMDSGGVFSMDAAGVPRQAGKALIEITVNYLDDFNQPQTVVKTLALDVRERNLPQSPNKEQPSETYPAENFWQVFVRFIKGLFGFGS